MSGGPANPERLLLALDESLDHKVRLILYGRSALWLGFNNPPAVAAATFDVDAIIPDAQVQALAEQDMADAEFMIRHDRITEGQLIEAFSQMKPFSLVELRDAFVRAKPVVLELARKAASVA